MLGDAALSPWPPGVGSVSADPRVGTAAKSAAGVFDGSRRDAFVRAAIIQRRSMLVDLLLLLESRPSLPHQGVVRRKALHAAMQIVLGGALAPPLDEQQLLQRERMIHFIELPQDVLDRNRFLPVLQALLEAIQVRLDSLLLIQRVVIAFFSFGVQQDGPSCTAFDSAHVSCKRSGSLQHEEDSGEGAEARVTSRADTSAPDCDARCDRRQNRWGDRRSHRARRGCTQRS